MAYTEKVSISGTALSFLLYECVNSLNSQEGFLIGDVTSEVTNHISDSQSDNTRLDTQIIIRTVLPLPSVALFYLPTGRIKEDVLSDLLSKSECEVIGWYKYRKNNSIKPTFRDKLISKGLQKYFEKRHGKKNFVTCNLSSKMSSAASTHTLTYRFGKINCFDMYEYIEDVTANLGEKLTGYKRPHRVLPNSIFNKIVSDTNVQSKNTSDAILQIQEAVNVRLAREAEVAAKNETTIRELEAEIKQMNSILYDKQLEDLQNAYDKMTKEKLKNREIALAQACVEALKSSAIVETLNNANNLMNSNNLSDSDSSVQLIETNKHERCTSPILVASSAKKPVLNYAAALRNNSDGASTSKPNNLEEDLISFDVNPVKKMLNDGNVKTLGDSSPEY